MGVRIPDLALHHLRMREGDPAVLPIHDTRLNFLLKLQIMSADFTYEKVPLLFTCKIKI